MNVTDRDGKDTFIHFDTAEMCQRFKAQYTGLVGHTCCSGKGCLLYDTSNKQMHIIKKTYLERHEGGHGIG